MAICYVNNKIFDRLNYIENYQELFTMSINDIMKKSFPYNVDLRKLNGLKNSSIDYFIMLVRLLVTIHNFIGACCKV